MLVLAEQGAGDMIQFSRYINLLKDLNIKIVIQCYKNLKTLFLESFSVKCISTDEEIINFDYQIFMMSLPLIFKTSPNRIPTKTPYIFAKNHRTEITNIIDKNKTKIGVCWSGNKLHEKNNNRSIPLKYFIDLATTTNNIFFSLYKDIDTNEKLILNNKIIDLSDYLTDFYVTASIIDKLDLIITVDTSIIHLAGAMNKKAYLLVNENNDWRWLKNTMNSSWYKSITILRNKNKNWDNVFQKLEKELISKLIL